MRISNSLTLKQLYRSRLKDILSKENIYINETDIHRIVREKNKELTNRILKNEDVDLHYKIGTLALRKKTYKPYLKDDKLRGLPPINWKKSKELNTKVYSTYNTVFKIILIKKFSSRHVKNYWRFRFTTTVNKRIYELASTNPDFDALEYVCTRKNFNR